MPRAARLRPLLIALVLALGTPAMTAQAQALASPVVATDGTLLSVSAQAEARRVPDIAHVSTGVVTRAADANAAMRANAEQMARVVAAIKAAGVAERDIQTSGISLNPDYRYAENQPPVITGYQASNTVNVTVRKVADMGRLLDALVATGANQINGPTFDVDDKDGAYDEARRKAIGKAQARADMYAKALGMRVRRIVSISEGGGFAPPRPMPMMAMAKMSDGMESTPVAQGENVLGVNLDIVFELGR